MKKIELTQGKYAIIDDEDYESASRFKWYASKSGRNWYAVRNSGPKGKQKTIYLHRFLLGDPNGIVDHINGNGLDCRKNNMRVCTHADNAKNAKKRITNTSGYIGVYWAKKDKRWRAQISIDGKVTYLGQYKDIKEAAISYDEAARKHHGEYAVTNF